MDKNVRVLFVIAVLLSAACSTAILATASVTASSPQGTLALFDAMDLDHNVTCRCAFDVKVMLTNITDGYFVTFHVHWDPAVLNLTNVALGDVFDHPGKATADFPGIPNYATGDIWDISTGHSQPDADSAKTYTDPDWGWVATLTFAYVGPPPNGEGPISSLIEIVYNPIPGRLSHWFRYPWALIDFETMLDCAFSCTDAPGCPRPRFTYTPAAPVVGEAVTFDASASTPNGGTITAYRWDFGDETTGTGQVINHTYTAPGTYKVQLNVTDSEGMWNLATKLVTAEIPLPPSQNGTIRLFDAVDLDPTIDWTLGAEPGTNPYFDVMVRLTNITDGYAVVFSVHWDPAVLNFTNVAFGDVFYHPSKPTLNLYGSINYATGDLWNFATGHAGVDEDSAKTYTDPYWGWVVTLTFVYVGPPPTVGSPIDTDIILVHNSSIDRPTEWYVYPSGQPAPFPSLTPCHFHYEAAPSLPPPGPAPTVGGNATPLAIPVANVELFAPYIGLSILLIISVVTIIYRKNRKSTIVNRY